MHGAGTKTAATKSSESLWLRVKRAVKARWRRRALILRAFLKRRELTLVINRTNKIARDDILLFSTMRNEMQRLPHFLSHHRGLGVSHFLIVVNDSDDGTLAYLQQQPDVSVWTTSHSYKAARFGVDWLNWLQSRYGSGHWCLTLDADELLVYPHHDTRDLRALTRRLENAGQNRLRTLMIELFPKGPIARQSYAQNQNPLEVLNWFDADGYVHLEQPGLRNEVMTGGPRLRMFFADEPRKAPTLSKMPLVKWHWRYAFVSSTHSLLPRRLNHLPGSDPDSVTGALLHTKFLPDISDRSRSEAVRNEHFEYGEDYQGYYRRLAEGPDFWHAGAKPYVNWRSLVDQGLMKDSDQGE